MIIIRLRNYIEEAKLVGQEEDELRVPILAGGIWMGLVNIRVG
jgi:hypothetical protein